MNKIKFSSYKLIIIMLIMIFAGYVGLNANASTLSDDIMDRVAEKIANVILGDFETVDTPAEEETLGWSTRDEIWLNNDSGVIYFDTDKGSGIRVNSGTMECKNSGGSWGACSGATPGDEGWLANSANLLMYPATNAAGAQYTLVLGSTATSGDAVLEVVGATIMDALTASGNAIVGGTLAVTGASTLTGNTGVTGTLTVTGAVENSTTLAQTGVATFNADPLIVGTTPTLTIGDGGAEDAALVYNGVQDFYIGVYDTDDDLLIGAGSTIGTTPAISIADDLSIVVDGTLNSTAAVDFDSTLNVDGAATVAAITGDGNWLTTGNISGANLTASGNLTAGGSLYVINSGDNVGIGSSTPFYRLSVVDTSAQLALAYDTAGQVTFDVDTGDDLTIVPSGGDVDITGTLAISSTLAVTGASTLTGAVGVTGAFTSAIDVVMTDGRLVGGVEATPTDCAANDVTIALATDAKTVVVADQAADAACAVTLSGGTAGEIVVLDLIYGGDKAWTFAAGTQYIGDTFDETKCQDFQATAVNGDHIVVTGIMTDATTIMPLSCTYLDQ